MHATEYVFGVSDFVAVVNQTFEYAYGSVAIEGELANVKISKGKWLYFDLKDDAASVRFFGTVYALPGPVEDGMIVRVQGMPRLHPQYGFSVSVQSMRPVGEGSLKKASELLRAQLEKEGLFAADRKRLLPYPPQRIGLIASGESAAYHDFMKIINGRWAGLAIDHIDVQVQGDAAVGQVVQAIQTFNARAVPVDVIVVTRGGGSADDLAAFSTEQVTRAVAASRIPTLVAIGHEVDTSLAELAADQRASTPSNAAEMLVPDKRQILADIPAVRQRLQDAVLGGVSAKQQGVVRARTSLHEYMNAHMQRTRTRLEAARALLAVLSPDAVLKRGYAVVRSDAAHLITRAADVRVGQDITIQFNDGVVVAEVRGISDDV